MSKASIERRLERLEERENERFITVRMWDAETREMADFKIKVGGR